MRRTEGDIFISLHFILSEAGPLTELEALSSDHTDWLARGSPCLYFPMLGLWASTARPGFLHKCWKLKLRSLCLHSTQPYLWSEPFFHFSMTPLFLCLTLQACPVWWLRRDFLLYRIFWSRVYCFFGSGGSHPIRVENKDK